MIIKVSALKGPVSMAAWGNRATTGKRNSALIFIQRDMQDLVNVKLARVLRRAWQEMFTSICFRREFLYHMAILCSYEISLSSLQQLYTCQTGNERLLCFTWSSCLVSLYYVVDNAWIVQTCIEDYDFDVFLWEASLSQGTPYANNASLGDAEQWHQRVITVFLFSSCFSYIASSSALSPNRLAVFYQAAAA